MKADSLGLVNTEHYKKNNAFSLLKKNFKNYEHFLATTVPLKFRIKYDWNIDITSSSVKRGIEKFRET